MKRLEQHWYQSSLTGLTFFLLPFSWLFKALVFVRRTLYRWHWKKSFHFKQPIIVVGNITVGGTGKTPFVIELVRFLKANGFKPGIVSRGVGGQQQKSPRWVSDHSCVTEVGDEAILLTQQTGCPLVIGIDRVAAVKTLLAETDCDVVVSDDGLQHYRLGRHIEIALVDQQRQLGNQRLLPAGPLRESVARLNEVDFLISHGGDALQDFVLSVKPSFKMQLHGHACVALKDATRKMSFQKMRIHAVAGIGNPERFFQFLKEQQFEVIPHVFPDHYFFNPSDLQFGDDLPIVMTEKDAVKCKHFADERMWYLPVYAILDEAFKQTILNRLQT